MPEWRGWRMAIVVAAAYIAVTALVRLMNRRRDTLINLLRRQAEAELRRRSALRRKKQSLLLGSRIRDQRTNKAA